jgi:hypothetical protein
METCDEIKDPSIVQLKVRLPLTEEDKLADLPSHASQPKKLLIIFRLKFASVYKKKKVSIPIPFEGGLFFLL